MRKPIWLVIVLLAACDETEPANENLAPKACGALADQELFIGETTEVEFCFEDPDGDTLKVSAMSADPAIVEVLRVREQVVDLSAGQVGSTTITVTAADPDGLAAEQTFKATVPNRPPEITEPIPGFEIVEGDTGQLGLGAHFRDPDGHELTYSTWSTDSAIALPSIVGGDSLDVAALRIGAARIGVEASDGHDVVSREVEAEVIEDPGTAGFLFDHAFTDRDRTLRHWKSQVYATLTVSGGKLHVSNDSIYRGWAYRNLGFTPWEEPPARVEYTTMAEYAEGGGVELAIHMRQVGMEYVSIGLGDSIPFDAGDAGEADTVYVDYGFAWYPGWPWRTDSTLWGDSDLVPGPGEQFEVRFVLDSTDVLIEIGGDTLLDFDLANYADGVPNRVRGAVLGVWPVSGTDRKASYDWARLKKLKDQ